MKGKNTKKYKRVSSYSSSDESEAISEDEDLFESEWNSSIHGGECQPVKNCSVNNKNTSNVQSTVNKNKDFIKEFNRFDRIIEDDNHQVKELENDIHNNELRFGSSLNEKLDNLKKKTSRNW